jgi:hypothetical protein
MRVTIEHSPGDGDGAGARDQEVDAVSRRLLDSAREVQRLEQQKRGTARSTEEFHDLADKIADKAHDVFALADAEEQMGGPDSPDPAERAEQEPGDWADSR